MSVTHLTGLDVLNNLVVGGNVAVTGNISMSGSLSGTLPAHNHAASNVNSGTLAHERGGLEADVSAWNGMPIIEGGATRQAKLGGDVGLHPCAMAKAMYDFATHGGDVGTIGLGVTLPEGAVIKRAWYLIANAFTSGGLATVSFGFAGGTESVSAAEAFDDTKYSEGWHDGISDDTAAKFVDASSKELAITIAVADLTAGEADIMVEYFID